ncbi:hypothetical protein C7M84_003765 [Penaeus vannamei]|uniref:Uncharacterized protein n=1 Tax=Penaeus vannamei TaxID=6689 RepID=A0A423TM99_PENVA|nr:hypothetical protein C7M84_003765 [Penaeus vannamei]
MKVVMLSAAVSLALSLVLSRASGQNFMSGGGGEIFSATSKLEDLMSLEGEVVRMVDRYLQATLSKVELMTSQSFSLPYFLFHLSSFLLSIFLSSYFSTFLLLLYQSFPSSLSFSPFSFLFFYQIFLSPFPFLHLSLLSSSPPSFPFFFTFLLSSFFSSPSSHISPSFLLSISLFLLFSFFHLFFFFLFIQYFLYPFAFSSSLTPSFSLPFHLSSFLLLLSPFFPRSLLILLSISSLSLPFSTFSPSLFYQSFSPPFFSFLPLPLLSLSFHLSAFFFLSPPFFPRFSFLRFFYQSSLSLFLFSHLSPSSLFINLLSPVSSFFFSPLLSLSFPTFLLPLSPFFPTFLLLFFYQSPLSLLPFSTFLLLFFNQSFSLPFFFFSPLLPFLFPPFFFSLPLLPTFLHIPSSFF